MYLLWSVYGRDYRMNELMTEGRKEGRKEEK